jgi:Xaa-Pro dipeptidase
MSGTSFHPIGLDRDRMLALMKEQDLGALLLTSPENVFYTSGYTALPSSGNPILYTLRNRLPFFSFVDGQGHISLLCWGFSAEGVDFGADEVIGFNDFGEALEAVRSVVGDRLTNDLPLAIESSCPQYILELLAGHVDSPILASADEVLEELRLIKSEAEIERITASTNIVERAVAELLDRLRLGTSRLELMREAKELLYHHGATGISHVTFSFGRENPEIAIDEPLEPGKLATIDLGAIVDGYCSDNRRYAYGGQPPASLVRRYQEMVEIIDRVGEALVPGTTYAELHALALGLFHKRGIESLGRFTHVGHNMGLETEEQWLDDSPEKLVRAGMVINIELYSFAETGEQIGNEETYVVREHGPECITQLPREIRVIK